jgi:pyruvate dehydrogenase E2 component (dihydrolipoamide acetyltransferase)
MADVVMPQMGESLAEGTVVRWLKQPGDRVERDEPLFEITTDKVDTDVPSPTAGTLRSILVREGETVAVGAPVAVIDDGVDAVTATPSGTPARETAASAIATQAEKPEESAAHFKNAHAPQLVSFRRAAAGASGTAEAVPSNVADAGRSPLGGGHPFRGAQIAGTGPANRSFSPAVLGMARDAGVPIQALTSMVGSGRGGRITKADVARFLESGGAAGPAAVRAARAPAPVHGGDVTEIPREYLYRPADDDQITPMSPVRRKIADHMTWSSRISPHASAFAECDMTAAVDFVRRERDAFQAREGVPLTFTVIAAVAFAHTLHEFRAFNASVVDDTIVVKPRVHLGIAVALPDSDDLIVPVVRDADGLSLSGMARAIADLANRARSRRLKVEDVQGGTVTLTNPGMFGGLTGTPILNQPQVAILGLGAIVKRAVVLADDSIVPRSMMTLSLTFDHRAADGMAAFKLLKRLRERLEAAGGEPL